MKLCSYVCNRCRLVCVKFYLNRSRLAVVLQNVKGLTFLGTHGSFNDVVDSLWFERRWRPIKADTPLHQFASGRVYRGGWQIAGTGSDAAFVGVLCRAGAEVVGRCPWVPAPRVVPVSADQPRQTVARPRTLVRRHDRHARPRRFQRRVAFRHLAFTASLPRHSA